MSDLKSCSSLLIFFFCEVKEKALEATRGVLELHTCMGSERQHYMAGSPQVEGDVCNQSVKK